jgi:hypothetical protein
MDQDERRMAADIFKKLAETKQTYITGFDYPLSISPKLLQMLEERRQAEAQRANIPDVQYEYEDVLFLLLGVDHLMQKPFTSEAEYRQDPTV